MNWHKGDVVYWCENKGTGKFEISWGMVDEEYSNKVCIDFLEPMETRRINGIPIDDFKDDRYHKLPKGWTYNTELYDLTFDPYPEEMSKLMINKPDDVKIGYDKGYLIKSSKKFSGEISTEITKEGYRVYKSYPLWHYHRTNAAVEKHLLRRTWEEAKQDLDANVAEFERQASLSDEEWSKELIQKDLDRWARSYGYDDKTEIYRKYKDYLFGLKNIEDIETRVSSEGLQWKYWKNKKWNTVAV